MAKKIDGGGSQSSGFTVAEHTRLREKADYAYALAHLFFFFFFSFSFSLYFQAPSGKKVAS